MEGTTQFWCREEDGEVDEPETKARGSLWDVSWVTSNGVGIPG